VVKALCHKPEGRGFVTRWSAFLNLPNPSGRSRPCGLLILWQKWVPEIIYIYILVTIICTVFGNVYVILLVKRWFLTAMHGSIPGIYVRFVAKVAVVQGFLRVSSAKEANISFSFSFVTIRKNKSTETWKCQIQHKLLQMVQYWNIFNIFCNKVNIP
jgi:hypothetical protein